MLCCLIAFLLSGGILHAQLDADDEQELYQRLSPRLENGNASADEIFQFIAVAPDIEPYMEPIERIAAKLPQADSNAIYRDIGMRLYLLGDIEAASRYLVRGDTEARVLGAQALVLLGEYQEAEELAAQILRNSSSSAVRQQAMTLMGSIYLQSDKELSALGIFEPFRYQPDSVLVPELLYLLMQYELQTNENATLDQYYTVLKDTFPNHPVTQIAGRMIGDRQSFDVAYKLIPTPEMLLFSVSPSLSMQEDASSQYVTDSSAVVSGETEDYERPRGIQVGSFGVRENAEYMADDIDQAGFPVTIEEQQRDDLIFYSVVIPVGEEHRSELESRFGTDSIEQIHLELRGAGFDGFRIY